MADYLVESSNQTYTSSSTSEEKQKKQRTSPLTRQELIQSVAWLLEEMIDQASTNYNDTDEIPNKTAFHAQKRPAISLKDYLSRFAQFSKCHDDVFVYAMIYLDKIGENYQEFELDSFNVHRLMLLSMVMACKFYDDYYYKNEYYAKIGGIQRVEFNKLEEEYLVNYIQFSLYVPVDSYTSYIDDLTKFHQDKRNEKGAY